MSEQHGNDDNKPAPPAAKGPAGGAGTGGAGGRRGRGKRGGDPGKGRSRVAGPQPTPVSASVSAGVDRQAKIALTVAMVAFIAAVGVAVTAFFTWREVDRTVAGQQHSEQQALTRAQGLEGNLQETARRMDGIQAQVERALDAQQREQREQWRQLGDAQDQMEDSLAVVRAQMGRSQDGWLLAEVEYLLRIANQRLLLQRDADTALAALMAADERLRALSDPGYMPVREALADEIAALKAAPRTDIEGLTLVLANLQQRVDGLQLAGARYVPAQLRYEDPRQTLAASDWREIPQVVWQAIRRLLAIRTHDQAATPMLPPEQQYFLLQNLRLVLEAARLSLLQRDPESYRSSLRTAERWLREHFDQDHPATGQMATEIGRLAEMDIRPTLPDIAQSLRLLRQQLDMNPAAAAADSAPSSPATDAAEPDQVQ